jgi:hypothetical protein
MRQEVRLFEFTAWSSLIRSDSVFESDMRDLDPSQYSERIVEQSIRR